MTKSEAIQQIRTAAAAMVPHLMKITPAAAKLEAPEVQAEILKHLHQLTTELEAIKKKVGRLERDDASTEL
jgi:hypothetical protein